MRKQIMKIRSQQIIPLGFLLLIAAGALLLMLPFATVPGEHTSPLTAMFTSTTCVCVTGLVVVDTFAHWTLFGQAVMLVLIQFGGLGIVAVASTVLLMVRRRLSLGEQLLISDSFSSESPRGIINFLKFVHAGTLIVEGIGACFYSFYFVPVYGFAKGIWVSVFLAVSAFCNAGIDLMGPNSMIPFQHNPYLLIITMSLIVLGGLGYVVWADIFNRFKEKTYYKKRKRFRFRHLSEHTRLVLVLTASLIAGGGLLVFLMERTNPATLGGMNTFDAVLNSVFQSVTYRTAGFASVPQDGLREASALVGDIIMFIGGSPVGTAGGVKTVTFFIVLYNSVCFIRGKKDMVLFNRRIHRAMVRKAAAIFVVNLMATLVFTVMLITAEGAALTDALYEITSAVATVGLSRGLTSNLHAAGRIIVIICMYLGRIGPISMALFFVPGDDQNELVTIANGNYYVG